MSQEFGVTEKTIRRDLEKLKSLAFPIVENKRRSRTEVMAACRPKEKRAADDVFL